jgi:hypothetical protein
LPSRAANPGSPLTPIVAATPPVAVVVRPVELSAAAAAVLVPPVSGHQRSSPGRPLLIAKPRAERAGQSDAALDELAA